MLIMLLQITVKTTQCPGLTASFFERRQKTLTPTAITPSFWAIDLAQAIFQKR